MSMHSSARFTIRPTLLGAMVTLIVLANGTSLKAQPDNVVDNQRLPTGQVIDPAGVVLDLPGRPNDLCYVAERELVFVKSHKALQVISTADWKLVQSIAIPGGASLTGIVSDQRGNVYLSNAGNLVHVFAPSMEEGSREYRLDHSLELPSNSFPCGLALSADETQLYVCLSKKNEVAVVDLAAKRVIQQLEVGIAPFDVQRTTLGNRLFVSNLGGRKSKEGDKTAPSAGTQTPVDERGIANTSLVSVIDLETMMVIEGLKTGLHPTAFALLAGSGEHEEAIVVTNTNDDTVTTIGSRSLRVKTEVSKPLADLPFGSMPNSTALSPDGRYLFVGLAGNNAVAVYDLANRPAEGLGLPVGFVPTAWYPAGLACSETSLFVACLKGRGSRNVVRPEDQGRNSHDHLGVVQKVALEEIADPQQLAKWTEQVGRTSRVLPLVRSQEQESTAIPRPVPEKLGDPSVFKHVIYVIKENRTYDQVFGDIKEGRGDERLCIFPEKITPNHHAMAARFGLLDNYYCNGILSADGHSWATEANVTPYLERAFGGFARSYTFGDDPLTYSSTGFLWDHVLAAGLSFRNYGEMDYSAPPAGMNGFHEIWKADQAGQRIEFAQNIGIEKLRRYSCRDYPGWNMNIPDVLRMDRFLEEFEDFKKDGTLPNLCIVYLPQDHLGGQVTSAAHMADNDLALGRLVEAISHSDYWKNTVIFVNEDDPQNGYDHIDGHRSICLVASAYSRQGANHNFYNQTSVIRTMLHILGLPPMNQQDARSPLMTDCFTLQPNLEPYKVIPANIPLNQKPGDPVGQTETERHWREILASVPIERTGMKTETDEDNLNRFVWHEMKGWKTPYPSQWSGAHSRGLKSLGLVHEQPAKQE